MRFLFNFQQNCPGIKDGNPRDNCFSFLFFLFSMIDWHIMLLIIKLIMVLKSLYRESLTTYYITIIKFVFFFFLRTDILVLLKLTTSLFIRLLDTLEVSQLSWWVGALLPLWATPLDAVWSWSMKSHFKIYFSNKIINIISQRGKKS